MNKIKMYKLVSKHIHLPSMKNTNFEKKTPYRNFNLFWIGKCGSDYRANLSYEDSNPILTININDKQNRVEKNILKVHWVENIT